VAVAVLCATTTTKRHCHLLRSTVSAAVSAKATVHRFISSFRFYRRTRSLPELLTDDAVFRRFFSQSHVPFSLCSKYCDSEDD
jgi:hypothetical protein